MTVTHFLKRLHCPACDCSDSRMVYSLKYEDPVIRKYLKEFYIPQGMVEMEFVAGAVYNLMECRKCKTIFQEYIPDDFLMHKLYEQWIDPILTLQEAENYPLDSYQYNASEIINLINYFGTIPTKLKFLDFGMGWGKWSLMAKAFGCQSFGMELSSARIEYAQRNGIQIIKWEDLTDRRFDFINTEQVFEHLPAPLETLKYLVQALKPEGLIKISVPNGNFASEKLRTMNWNAPKYTRNSLNVFAPLEHINCFNTHSIRTMAVQCGLAEIKVPLRFIGYSSLKEKLKIKLRPYYHRLIIKGGSITIFFKKST